MVDRSRLSENFHPDKLLNQSYFSKVQDILNIYDLPKLQCLSKSLTSKEIWKIQVKRAINKHWSELLQKEALEKSTLKYMNIDLVGIGRTVVDFLHVRTAQTHTSLQFSYTQSANIDEG